MVDTKFLKKRKKINSKWACVRRKNRIFCDVISETQGPKIFAKAKQLIDGL